MKNKDTKKIKRNRRNKTRRPYNKKTRRHNKPHRRNKTLKRRCKRKMYIGGGKKKQQVETNKKIEEIKKVYDDEYLSSLSSYNADDKPYTENDLITKLTESEDNLRDKLDELQKYLESKPINKWGASTALTHYLIYITRIPTSDSSPNLATNAGLKIDDINRVRIKCMKHFFDKDYENYKTEKGYDKNEDAQKNKLFVYLVLKTLDKENLLNIIIEANERYEACRTNASCKVQLDKDAGYYDSFNTADYTALLQNVQGGGQGILPIIKDIIPPEMKIISNYIAFSVLLFKLTYERYTSGLCNQETEKEIKKQCFVDNKIFDIIPLIIIKEGVVSYDLATQGDEEEFEGFGQEVEEFKGFGEENL